ncbi:MAG: phosphopyruvate hydratase, partial [Patescibacteria group bacterium]
MIKIQKVSAKEIFDSRGTPTLAVTVATGDLSATFAVPSGASTGSNEALELRDGDKKYHGGKGVNYVIANVNGPINDALVDMDVLDQRG